MDLIQEVALLSQLPPEEVSKELYRIAENQGIDTNNIEMSDLRIILSEFMQEVLVNLKADAWVNASQA